MDAFALNNADEITAWALSPDESRLVLAEREAVIFDAKTHEPLFTLRGHESRIYSMAFSPDGKWLATGDQSSTVKLWNVEEGQEIFSFNDCNPEKKDALVSALAFSSDSKWLATGDISACLSIWNLTTREKLFSVSYPLMIGLEFSGDNQYVLVKGMQFSAVLSVLEQKIIREYGYAIGSTLSEDGDSFYISARVYEPTVKGSQILKIKFDTGEVLWHSPVYLINTIHRNVFRNGKLILAAIEAEQKLILYHVDKGVIRIFINDGDTYFSLTRFTPSGKRVAGVLGNEFYLWDISDLLSYVPGALEYDCSPDH